MALLSLLINLMHPCRITVIYTDPQLLNVSFIYSFPSLNCLFDFEKSMNETDQKAHVVSNKTNYLNQ